MFRAYSPFLLGNAFLGFRFAPPQACMSAGPLALQDRFKVDSP